MTTPTATTPHPRNSGLRVDLNPAAAVASNARWQGDAVVVRYTGGDLTYAQLDDKAARLATALAEGGTTDGDRIAHLGLNSSSFLVTMLAAFRLGAVFVPVNFRLAEPELQRVLDGGGATVVVCEEGHRASVETVRAGTRLTRFLLVDDDPEAPTAGADGWEPWSSLIAAARPASAVAVRHASRYAEHGVLLRQAWGLTETAPFATHLPAERTLDKIGSAGIPMPFTEIRVVDAITNEPVGPGEPGEIVVRGPHVTAGTGTTRRPTGRRSTTRAGSTRATSATSTRTDTCTSSTG